MMTTARVGLVFVSHSVAIAEGLADLAGQMAPNVRLVPAGGTDVGGLGTSFDKVSSALATADSGAGVVVLCDLGSAILAAETALDFLDDEARARVQIVDAPIVEGGVAAAVAAETGGDLDAVVAAARTAIESVPVSAAAGTAGESGYRRTLTLLNKDGLHARPAAEFVQLASTFDTLVTVNGTDARSLLGIMGLGIVRGMTVEIRSEEAGGEAAVDALADLIESGFGEN